MVQQGLEQQHQAITRNSPLAPNGSWWFRNSNNKIQISIVE
jgi:hypothetical protein